VKGGGNPETKRKLRIQVMSRAFQEALRFGKEWKENLAAVVLGGLKRADCVSEQ